MQITFKQKARDAVASMCNIEYMGVGEHFEDARNIVIGRLIWFVIKKRGHCNNHAFNSSYFLTPITHKQNQGIYG